MSYLNFGKKEIDPKNLEIVNQSYSDGFVFVRNGFGLMEKVRSLRINLDKFQLSSENRRILKKYNSKIELIDLPFKDYSWEIHKLGKDFYDEKFGKDTFSANKIKEIFTENSTNFNSFFRFENLCQISSNSLQSETPSVLSDTLPKEGFLMNIKKADGYCICYKNDLGKFLHYAYPFYKLDLINNNFGIFMMTKSIQFAKENGFKFIYLGSSHDEKSKYKLQFKGIEWFDEKTNSWFNDIECLKSRLITH